MSLADSLGGLETRDWVERVGYALDWGNVKFVELLNRRQSLSMDAVDAATMDSILDTI